MKIILEDVTGSREIEQAGPTLASTLASMRLPLTMFQSYFVESNDVTPIPHWTRLDTLTDSRGHVIVRALRNTLFETILPPIADQRERWETGVGFENIVPGDSTKPAKSAHVVLTPQQSRDLVVREVRSFVNTHRLSDRGCVVGISGGGDSTALAYGLREAVPRDRLLAFTLVFSDVMTQSAADRAVVLCQELGINHVVLQPDDLENLLEITTSLHSLHNDFSEVFGSESVHFFGTFLILKTARTLASQKHYHNIALGYNREDLLAEMLFLMVNGSKPLSYPIRNLGQERIVMPVWRIPKLLLDACHPRFSLENYRERDANTTRQRSLAFYLGHALDSIYPSFGLSLLQGVGTALSDSFSPLTYDSDLDIYVTALATDKHRQVVRDLLNRHFSTNPRP